MRVVRTKNIEVWGRKQKFRFVKTAYAENNTTAIQVLVWDEDEFGGWWIPFSILTVNLSSKKQNRETVFIDTNNNPPSLVNFLERNGYIEMTGDVGFSGFCIYPLAKITNKFNTILSDE